jgi:hypothetical protein
MSLSVVGGTSSEKKFPVEIKTKGGRYTEILGKDSDGYSVRDGKGNPRFVFFRDIEKTIYP